MLEGGWSNDYSRDGSHGHEKEKCDSGTFLRNPTAQFVVTCVLGTARWQRLCRDFGDYIIHDLAMGGQCVLMWFARPASWKWRGRVN